MAQNVIFTNQLGSTLDSIVEGYMAANVFVLVDSNTKAFVLPVLTADSKAAANATVITCPAGDMNKNLESLQRIWQSLSTGGASRQAVLINLGGGVVTDLGGFAAATFKRGIHCINIPTTLLGAVDAAVGGKTGINFNGYKNQIGAFAPADAVIISTVFFPTLSQQELLSGYGEMIKHALLSGPQQLDDILRYQVLNPPADPDRLLALIKESVEVKQRIVEQDPLESGLRRALNLGHTVGHAFESLALKRMSPIPHGYAVVWGLVVELVLSHLRLGFSSELLHRIADYIFANYGAYDITCDDYPALLDFMQQDKKNTDTQHINFTLLKAPGDFTIDCTADADEISAALDIYRDLAHI